VFDVGGRGDKSFNDAAYAGLDSAKRTLGIEFQTLETGEGADREAAMRQLAATGSQLVFGVGFLFSDDIKSLALEFPDVKFACVDYTVKEGGPGHFRKHRQEFKGGPPASGTPGDAPPSGSESDFDM